MAEGRPTIAIGLYVAHLFLYTFGQAAESVPSHIIAALCGLDGRGVAH